MNRRHWPIALALLSVGIFGSYLLYTEYLVRHIKRDALIQMEMYRLVQQGIYNPEASTEAQAQEQLRALLELQQQIIRLGVPVIVINAAGEVQAAANMPFEHDLASAADQIRLKRHAAALEDENGSFSQPGLGEVYFGAPPILQGLRWIPWLQVSLGFVTLIVALGLIWANLRAERERLWAAMARELAHQMGTPLSSMAGWLEVLRLPEAQRAELGDDRRIAQELEADLERLERVSRRFELIGQQPRLEVVELRPLLEELELYLRPRLPRVGHEVRFGVRVDPALPPIRANRVLLLWALENLVKNALDALAGRGGRIRVAGLAPHNERVRIAVVDDGPGIPANLRERVFEPGVTTKSRGWGVGLSLARRIVEEIHGGRIAVRARRGGGTVFMIELPTGDGAPRHGPARRTTA